MSALRVELFFDDEAGNWHYRVPALHINGGGTPTREDAERDCLSAIAFALEGDPRDYDTDAETLAFDVNVRQQRSQPDSTAASGCHRRIEVQRTQSAPCGMSGRLSGGTGRSR